MVYKADEARYDSGMKYERCGKSGILLPRISLGLWHNFGDVDSLSRSREILHYAFDRGVVCFDLANNYGPSYGSAEATFGRVMKDSFRPYRDEMIITTKAGFDMWPGPYGNFGSRKYLMASLDQSLARMNLDYVDIFYSHRFDPDTPMEETLQALVDIVRQGKALYVGLSNWPAPKAEFAYEYLRERDVPALIYQGRYNMIDRRVETDGVLAGTQAAGVGFTAYSPLEQGVLTSRYFNGIPDGSRASHDKFLHPDRFTPELLQILQRLDDIARQRGQTLAQMAVAWLLRTPAVTSVIVGASSRQQLADTLASLENIAFSDFELAEIDKILATEIMYGQSR